MFKASEKSIIGFLTNVMMIQKNPAYGRGADSLKINMHKNGTFWQIELNNLIFSFLCISLKMQLFRTCVKLLKNQAGLDNCTVYVKSLTNINFYLKN